jgi:hypothetical protein
MLTDLDIIWIPDYEGAFWNTVCVRVCVRARSLMPKRLEEFRSYSVFK